MSVRSSSGYYSTQKPRFRTTNAPSGQRRSTGVESANGAHAWHASNFTPERSSANWSRTPSANQLRQGPNGTYADALYWFSMSPAGSSEQATRRKGRGRRKLHNQGVPISKSSWVDRTRRKYDHPAQKPADPVRRPSLNRTRRGWPTYNPFLGSSTKLAAAELNVRLCLGVQLDAKYVDVIVQRWQARNAGRPNSRD